ncbi:hypothetical protein [Pedobacter jamesrossensis]|uniref:DUF1828 domain-containing protein n=1 Tax=Pedobacter jamesrossensis TaxID=1908238 RepID=A0ABV8NGJ9_9SPHI
MRYTLGVYNHGELFIKGATTAWLVYADDMDFHIEKFGGIEAVISNQGQSIMLNSILKDTDGSTIYVKNYFPSTNRLSDIVLDDYVEINEYGVEGLTDSAISVVQDGLSLIDHNKKAKFEYADFPQRLKEMFAKLASLNEVKTNNVISNIENDKCIFYLFTYEGVDYQQLMLEIGRGYSIRMRTLLNKQTEDCLLLLEYLDENGIAKYQWQDNAESKMLEMKCVKKAMIDAYEILTQGLPE